MDSNKNKYETVADLPTSLPVFPLTAALLLPNGNLPLNIFEPRYLAMIDAALAGDRMIGMIQPAIEGQASTDNGLCQIGCAGRLVSFSETSDGRYMIGLVGICRFSVQSELETTTPFRQVMADWSDFEHDLKPDLSNSQIDRDLLLKTFRAYLDQNDMEADWDSIEEADTGLLVNALSMMSPYGAAEKQAFLEAKNLKQRADTLVAITEMSLARQDTESGVTLQ
ncbi:MAG: LON peptidase substrate-binding domain-containing protein [Hyphomicrobiales bacterium]